MSHYVKMEVQYKNVSALVEALVANGISRGHIEVHETPVRVNNFSGAPQSQRAHVVIRRENVGYMCNDIGFFVDPTGEHSEAYVCKFAARPKNVVNEYVKARGGFGESWLAAVSQCYAVQEVTQYHAERGETVYQTESEDGTVHLYVNQ